MINLATKQNKEPNWQLFNRCWSAQDRKQLTWQKQVQNLSLYKGFIYSQHKWNTLWCLTEAAILPLFSDSNLHGTKLFIYVKKTHTNLTDGICIQATLSKPKNDLFIWYQVNNWYGSAVGIMKTWEH